MTDSRRLTIRPLKLSEIPRAVAIHQSAFPGFFLTFLGPDFLKLLYSFYVQGETEVALVGEYKGQVIGTLLGTTQPHGFYKRLATRYFLSFAWARLNSFRFPFFVEFNRMNNIYFKYCHALSST